MLQDPQRRSVSFASNDCGAHHQPHSFGIMVQAGPVERDLDLGARPERAIRNQQNAGGADIYRTSGAFPSRVTPHSVLQAGHKAESLFPAPFLVPPVGRRH
jgi:hypothetical protein